MILIILILKVIITNLIKSNIIFQILYYLKQYKNKMEINYIDGNS